MWRLLFAWRARAAACLPCLLLSACAAGNSLQPFSTDGCSLFPDQARLVKADWCHCCVAHDLAYWRGGSADARLEADRALKACVWKVSGSEALAALMFEGVRAGGGPEFRTAYRWGYGWPYGRSYAPLTPEEDALASSLSSAYVARNPGLSCTAHSAAAE